MSDRAITEQLRGLSLTSSRVPQERITEFHGLIRTGDVASVRVFLEETPDLANTRDPNNGGISSLMVATMSPQAMTLIDLLIDKGARLNTQDDLQRTVLLHACANGASLDVIRQLYQHSEELCLRQAASRRLSRHLPSRQLTWTQCDITDRTALELACAAGHVDLVEAILKWDPDIDVRAKCLIVAAIEFGNEDLVLRLLSSTCVCAGLVDDYYAWWEEDSHELANELMTRRMFDALRALHSIRPGDVEKALDAYAFGVDAFNRERVVIKDLPPDIQKIAKKVRLDKLWTFAWPMLMLRRQSDGTTEAAITTIGGLFTLLPDFAFMRVLTFGRPLFLSEELDDLSSESMSVPGGDASDNFSYDGHYWGSFSGSSDEGKPRHPAFRDL